jgi:hypothetical protein
VFDELNEDELLSCHEKTMILGKKCIIYLSFYSCLSKMGLFSSFLTKLCKRQ